MRHPVLVPKLRARLPAKTVTQAPVAAHHGPRPTMADDLRSRTNPPWLADATTVTWLQRVAGNQSVIQLLQRQAVATAPPETKLAEHPFAGTAAAVTPVPAPAPAPVGLKLGDGPSARVGALQQQLNVASGAAHVPVTGYFDAATEAAVKAFQTAEKIPITGVVDRPTRKRLDKKAPHVTRTKDRTVLHPGTAVEFARGHPTISKALGSSGMGVRELQERLNTSPVFQLAAIKSRKKAGGGLTKRLKVNGTFDDDTDAAVKLFQASMPHAQTGVVDPATWAALEQQGIAHQGRVELAWTEEVEGVTNVGTDAKYNWKLSAERLLITVGINFQKPSGKPSGHARVSAWMADIADVWSAFRAVRRDHKVDIDFRAVRGSDFTVTVIVDSPANPGRSDSANWHTGDLRRGLAPHEFGHLLGFADEYNRPEEQYVKTTGEEAPVGPGGGTVAAAKALAQQINAQIPLTDNTGAALASLISGSAIGGTQGRYSRLVAAQYRALYATDLVTAIRNAFIAKGITGFDANKSAAVQPFLVTSQSIMGSMTTVPAKRGGKVALHDHPMQPRHVEPFLNIIRQIRGGKWEAKYRS